MDTENMVDVVHPLVFFIPNKIHFFDKKMSDTNHPKSTGDSSGESVASV